MYFFFNLLRRFLFFIIGLILPSRYSPDIIQYLLGRNDFLEGSVQKFAGDFRYSFFYFYKKYILDDPVNGLLLLSVFLRYKFFDLFRNRGFFYRFFRFFFRVFGKLFGTFWNGFLSFYFFSKKIALFVFIFFYLFYRRYIFYSGSYIFKFCMFIKFFVLEVRREIIIEELLDNDGLGYPEEARVDDVDFIEFWEFEDMIDSEMLQRQSFYDEFFPRDTVMSYFDMDDVAWSEMDEDDFTELRWFYDFISDIVARSDELGVFRFHSRLLTMGLPYVFLPSLEYLFFIEFRIFDLWSRTQADLLEEEQLYAYDSIFRSASHTGFGTLESDLFSLDNISLGKTSFGLYNFFSRRLDYVYLFVYNKFFDYVYLFLFGFYLRFFDFFISRSKGFFSFVRFFFSFFLAYIYFFFRFVYLCIFWFLFLFAYAWYPVVWVMWIIWGYDMYMSIGYGHAFIGYLVLFFFEFLKPELSGVLAYSFRFSPDNFWSFFNQIIRKEFDFVFSPWVVNFFFPVVIPKNPLLTWKLRKFLFFRFFSGFFVGQRENGDFFFRFSFFSSFPVFYNKFKLISKEFISLARGFDYSSKETSRTFIFNRFKFFCGDYLYFLGSFLKKVPGTHYEWKADGLGVIKFVKRLFMGVHIPKRVFNLYNNSFNYSLFFGRSNAGYLNPSFVGLRAVDFGRLRFFMMKLYHGRLVKFFSVYPICYRYFWFLKDDLGDQGDLPFSWHKNFYSRYGLENKAFASEWLAELHYGDSKESGWALADGSIVGLLHKGVSHFKLVFYDWILALAVSYSAYFLGEILYEPYTFTRRWVAMYVFFMEYFHRYW